MVVAAWAGAGSIYSDAIVLACGHEVGCDEIGDKCRHCATSADARVTGIYQRFELAGLERQNVT